jgi:hypothetical protein
VVFGAWGKTDMDVRTVPNTPQSTKEPPNDHVRASHIASDVGKTSLRWLRVVPIRMRAILEDTAAQLSSHHDRTLAAGRGLPLLRPTPEAGA